MGRFAFVFGAALPLALGSAALAEDVVIRIEAKRGAEAAQASAEAWGAQFPDVVTFPLSEGWVGIALGPMPREDAAARLDELKQQRKVPGDSFIATAEGRSFTPLNVTAAAEPANSAGNASTFPQDTAAAVTGDPASPAVAPEPVAEPEPAKFFLRLESSPNLAKAEEMLEKWRQTLPDPGSGPCQMAARPSPLARWTRRQAPPGSRRSKMQARYPRTPSSHPPRTWVRSPLPARRPSLAPPAPEAEPVSMPPLEDIQRALRWAGHYEGSIDGKDGPMTRAAIAAEIVRLRASPDTATAMAELIARRAAWRAEMGLAELQDSHTGLTLPAPMDKLQFERAERALSIYGPKDGSGAALILFHSPAANRKCWTWQVLSPPLAGYRRLNAR
ncbi:peptidoglycan-binding protein [Paracoccus kondratievae]